MAAGVDHEADDCTAEKNCCGALGVVEREGGSPKQQAGYDKSRRDGFMAGNVIAQDRQDNVRNGSISVKGFGVESGQEPSVRKADASKFTAKGG